MTDLNNEGPSGNQQQPPPPPRKRRTHKSPIIIAALADLPKSLKKKKNAEIVERNAEREFKRAEHVDDPTNCEDASDDESLITVSDDEDAASPTTRLADIMEKLTPTSRKVLIRATLTNKRQRDNDDVTKSEARRQVKKLCEEVEIDPGMSLPIAFNNVLHDLYSHGVYIPPLALHDA
ncbi:hypothetical protein MVEN_00191700 [Mycena venus]|uniref:Uncharacterized protein n=1 Tax=Mycena venus TaxID=2733690 RepID=A0A8H6Z1E5_9AGAR|nr:hypothetical protein MVEN_00191700 [Mycena venus]